jgi:phage gpG-like protein
MKFEVLVFGDKLVSTKFERMNHDVLNAKPAFNEVARYMMEATDTTFQSQGRRGGGSWKRLSPGWSKYKLRHAQNPLILHQFHPRSGSLRRSVTRPRAKGQILEITDTKMRLGSSLPYAARHQYGYGHTPARPYLKFTKNDAVKIRGMIRDHLMQVWEKGRTG